MSLLDTASLIVTPNAYKEGKLYSVIPSDGSGDMNVARATTATRVNSAGLVESVATDVPRLDYSNGSCPSLLVEPQRTNTITYSEDINNSFAAKVGVTITSNNTTSPDGTQNADLLKFDTTSGYILRGQTVAPSTTYTMSVFVKNNNFTSGQLLTFNMSDGVIGGVYAQINVVAKTAVYEGALGAWTSVSGKVEDFGNGWFRVSVTGTSIGGGNGWYEITAQGITNSCFVWGFQLELGSYPTSYIPTTTASVTRNADAISKTGISSLIGQTEGVLFLDLFASAKNDDTNTYGTWLVAGTAAENFQIYNLGTTLYWYARNTGGIIIDQTANQTIVEGTRYKIAIAYKSGDYALYINGVQKRTSANANIPVAVSQFNLSAGGYGSAPAVVKNEYNSAIFFPTRLTNAQLAQLTTL